MLLFFNTGQKKYTAMPAPATPPRQNAYYGKTKCAFRLNDNAYCLNEMRTLFPRRRDTVKTRGGTCAFPCGKSAIRSRAGMKKASLPQGKDAVNHYAVNVPIRTHYLSRVQMLTRFQSGSLNMLPTPWPSA